MPFPWLIVGYVAATILSKVLFRQSSHRQSVRKEKFELPRTTEGEALPIVLGVAELAPNFVWFGQVTRRIFNQRTLYYANAVGPLCHGPLKTIHDILWEDLHLSAAPASTGHDLDAQPGLEVFGDLAPLGPALSVPLPHTLAANGFLEEMINALGWFGGIDTSDGMGGIAGRMCVHGGGRDQAVCAPLRGMWGADYTPAWPDIAYIVLGGVALPCPPDTGEFVNLMQPFKWSTDNNPFDGIAAGGGGAAPIGNGELQCFGATFPDPLIQEQAPHQIRCDDGVVYAADAAGVHLVPPSGSQAGFRLTGVVSGGVGCPNCALTILPAPAGTMIFANCWQTCFGCTQAYNHVAHRITCLRPGDKVRIRFNWTRTRTYHFRFPNGFDTIGPGGLCGFQGAVSIGSEKTYVRPEYVSGWSWGYTFDVGARPVAYDAPLSGSVDWTSPAIPQTSEDDYGNVSYLSLTYLANWRTAWSEVILGPISIEVLPGGDESQAFLYMPGVFTQEGKFYHGTNPRPFPPRVLASVIPTGVSGAGILHGANPIDGMFEVITNPTWGMAKDPDTPIGVNLTNLQAAAAVCAAEGRQFSHTWSDRHPAEDLLEDLATVAEAIPYINRETGLWEVALLRADYDVSLLPSITPDNADSLVVEMPHGMELVNELRVTYRRWKPSLRDEVFTDYELGPAVKGAAYQMPGASPTSVVVTQDGNVIDADDYSVSSTGVLRLDSRADSIDFDSAEPLLISFVAGTRRAGFEDAVATAFNEALFHALGENRSATLEVPQIMDDVTAQRFVESQLLARSRPLKAMRWTMQRTIPGLHPGSMVKLTWPLLALDGLPTRILDVREPVTPGGAFEVEAIEEKYGFRDTALIFHVQPERPPLNFPGDDTAALGTAPRPAGVAQITPSSARLALFAAGDEWSFEIARTRNPEKNGETFYVGDAGEFGPDGCAADTPPAYFTAPVGSTTFDDPDAPDDDCPVFYWIRHVRNGYLPSPWIGPIEAVLEAGTPADSQLAVLPVLDLEDFEDAQNEIGYANLWLRDPQLRIRRVSYRVRLPGEEWGNEVTPPIGNGLFEGAPWRNEEGWRSASTSVALRLDDAETDVQFRVEYAGEDGATVIRTLTTTFPLELEPVWDDDGQVVTHNGEVVTASKRDDVEWCPPLELDGEPLFVDGEPVTVCPE